MSKNRKEMQKVTSNKLQKTLLQLLLSVWPYSLQEIVARLSRFSNSFYLLQQKVEKKSLNTLSCFFTDLLQVLQFNASAWLNPAGQLLLESHWFNLMVVMEILVRLFTTLSAPQKVNFWSNLGKTTVNYSSFHFAAET